MSQAFFEPEHIFGIHEPGGERFMLASDRSGWIVFNEAIGQDVNDYSGADFTPFANQGLGIICRLNHGYAPDGTIPHSSQYEAFARRVANFVNTSRGCHIWVIGNEMNYVAERPGATIDWSRHNRLQASRTQQGFRDPLDDADPMHRGVAIRFDVLPENAPENLSEIRSTRGAVISPGEVITPALYTECFTLCRDAIQSVPGHEADQVIVGAVAPWCTQTIYPGNPNGDWIRYFNDMLTLLGPDNCDGFALHAYTRGANPALITSDERLIAPFQTYHAHFRSYRDFMAAVPSNMQDLAVYITETDQGDTWVDGNQGWIQRAYAEIHQWNRNVSHQRVRALCLYRWPRMDKWYIDGKAGVVDDFLQALRNDYRWLNARDIFVSPARAAAQAAIPEPVTPAPVTPAPVTPAPAVPAPAASAPVTPDPAAPDPITPTDHHTHTPDTTLPAYQVEWVDDYFPSSLYAGEVVTAKITIRNDGYRTWTQSGAQPFLMGYHYYRNRKRLAMPTHQERLSPLPHDMPTGVEAVVDLQIALPEQPGNYTLEVDLIEQGVAWLKEQGSPVLIRWLTVEERLPSNTPSDGTQAVSSGVFLDALSSVYTDTQDPTQSLLPVPLFHDIISLMPRGLAVYAQRPLDQVRYLVFSHTGSDPYLNLDLIAQTHIQHGYPGIAYDFVIDAEGQVYKVTQLEDIVDPGQAWSAEGVNICLAGNFNEQMPTLNQLDAAGRLCGWLSENFGLTPDAAIVGLGELTASSSPGNTFYMGPMWKELLIRQVKLHLAAFRANHAGYVDGAALDSQLLALKTENSELQRQLEAIQDTGVQVQQQTARLQAELDEARQQLASQLARATADVGTNAPRIQNIVQRLPRDGSRYVNRATEDVEYIVINHTGVGPDVSLRQIAEAHMPDWPGILYDFCIDEHGIIYQTQPLDEVVETQQTYLSHAVNIAFAGEFSEAVPSDGQLLAGGRLITWLMDRFPQLEVNAIKGISEFIAHDSPGRQWQSGANWKESLLAAVRRASGLVDPSTVESDLRTRLLTMERQLATAQQQNAQLQEQQLRLQSDNQRLQGELLSQEELQAQTVQSYVIPPPAMRVMTEQLPTHAVLRYERRPLSQLSHIAIHHTAAPPNMELRRIAELHVAADPNRGKEPWPGIGYHFFVHEDGSIDQTNDFETTCYHVYKHNNYTVGVAFAGSFMNGKIPTTAQLRSGAHLVAWLMQELHIPLARVWGHREYPENTTVCPGGEWQQGNRWRDLLFERIEQVQSGVGIKSIRHYLMLWQRPYPGPFARQDLVNAIGYIERFRPSVGFSLEDAKHAEYVTILGTETGVSTASERLLRGHGCKVERVTGRHEEETGRILAEMTRLGRRFRTFEVEW